MARMEKQPEIVMVRDFFEANNTAYIVMEYVEGTNFKELTEQRGGRIPPEELFRLISPLFGALSAMHAAGLIHRDISPDNLMLEARKRPPARLRLRAGERRGRHGDHDRRAQEGLCAHRAVLRQGAGAVDGRLRPLRHDILLPHRRNPAAVAGKDARGRAGAAQGAGRWTSRRACRTRFCAAWR